MSQKHEKEVAQHKFIVELQSKATIQQHRKSSLDFFSTGPTRTESVNCCKLTLMIQALSENADELHLYQQGLC